MRKRVDTLLIHKVFLDRQMFKLAASVITTDDLHECYIVNLCFQMTILLLIILTLRLESCLLIKRKQNIIHGTAVIEMVGSWHPLAECMLCNQLHKQYGTYMFARLIPHLRSQTACTIITVQFF